MDGRSCSSQFQLHHAGNVLILIGHFERTETDKTVGRNHNPAHEVVQEICLATVGHTGYNHQSSLVGGVKQTVGQRAVPHAVTMVEVAVQHLHHLVGLLLHTDDVARTDGQGFVDNIAYHLASVGGHHLANIFAIVR